jgi:hypothetical protein
MTMSLGYCCLMSTNTEIASFWLRVSLRFQRGDKSDRKWKQYFYSVHILSWVTMFSVTFVMIEQDTTSFTVALYNGTIIFYATVSWFINIFAYRTIYTNTISRLTMSVSSSPSIDIIKRKKIKSLNKLTMVSMGCITAFTLCIIFLILVVVFKASESPLGYLILVGYCYRFGEFVIILPLLWVLGVQNNSKCNKKSNAHNYKKNSSKGRKKEEPKTTRNKNRDTQALSISTTSTSSATSIDTDSRSSSGSDVRDTFGDLEMELHAQHNDRNSSNNVPCTRYSNNGDDNKSNPIKGVFT